MFNGDDVVVADEAKGGGDVAPGLFVVAEADGAEGPCSVCDLIVGFVVVAAVDIDVDGVDVAIFSMDVVDGFAEGADGGDGIDTVPEEVAGIEVATDGGVGAVV